MNFQILGSFLVVLFVTSGLSGSIDQIQGRDFCACETCTAQKFFILNNLLFFTTTPDKYGTFNAFNISSGGISPSINTSSYLPNTDFRFQQIGGPNKTARNKTSRVPIWMFGFDIKPEACQQSNDQRFNSYCSRMRSLRNVVVGRLTNQQLFFVGYRNGKLIPVSDMSLFVEFHALFKHLDEFGYTSSVTFDQNSNQFYTTHFGRLNEICVTRSMNPEQNVYGLPSMSEIMSTDVFHTVCYDTENPYTSVIDINGNFYAIMTDGKIDQIALVPEDGLFEILQTNSDKLFFNCMLNSPITGKLQASSFEFRLAEKPLGLREAPQTLTDNVNVMPISDRKSNPDPEVDNNNNKSMLSTWLVTFFFVFLIMVLVIPVLMYTSMKGHLGNYSERFRNFFEHRQLRKRKSKGTARRTTKDSKTTLTGNLRSKITIRTKRQPKKAEQEEKSDSDKQSFSSLSSDLSEESTKTAQRST